MKIHPPKLVIDEKEPFKGALFGRKQFAESLTTLLRNVTDNLVVFVHAPWGEGKTTFARMWRARLRELKLDTIYYDAYAADYFDDAFVSFSGEILELVDKRFSEVTGMQEPRREFKKTAIEVGKRLAGLAVKVGMRAATLGAVEAAHVDELKSIGSEVASGVSEISSKIIEEKIEKYTVEKDRLKVFKESLAKLATAVREQQGFPLTIIVDELDRCRPDFALALLERIKHLFDVENVAFVLLVNRGQIEKYVNSVYGEVDARDYLLKFGNLFVDLPTRSAESHWEPGRAEYCETLVAHHDFSKVGHQDFLMGCLKLLVEHFGLTLRQIEKVFAALVLYYGSLRNEATDPFFVTMLSILKVKEPSVYERLTLGGISADELFAKTGLAHFRAHDNRMNEDWAKAAIKYCLMSDADAAKAVESTDHALQSAARDYGRGSYRTQYIPRICHQLNRFSLKP